MQHVERHPQLHGPLGSLSRVVCRQKRRKQAAQRPAGRQKFSGTINISRTVARPFEKGMRRCCAESVCVALRRQTPSPLADGSSAARLAQPRAPWPLSRGQLHIPAQRRQQEGGAGKPGQANCSQPALTQLVLQLVDALAAVPHNLLQSVHYEEQDAGLLAIRAEHAVR